MAEIACGLRAGLLVVLLEEHFGYMYYGVTLVPHGECEEVCFRYFAVDAVGKPGQEDDLLSEGRLYYPRPAQFPDKHEFEFKVEPYPLQRSLMDWFKGQEREGREREQGGPDIAEYLRTAWFDTLSNALRVGCFTDRPNNAHLWDAFAAGRSGYMVAFRANAFADRASRPRRVEYAPEIPVISGADGFDANNDDMIRVVFRKHPQFHLEEELRSIVWRRAGENDDPFVVLGRDALAFIVLGDQMPAADQARILALVDQYLPGLSCGISRQLDDGRIGLGRIR